MLRNNQQVKLVLTLEERAKIAFFVQVLMTANKKMAKGKGIKAKESKTKPKYKNGMKLARSAGFFVEFQCKNRTNLTPWAYA